MSGRYASYWNAFLFTSTCVTDPLFCSELKGHTLYTAIETTLTSRPSDAIYELAETIVRKLNPES